MEKDPSISTKLESVSINDSKDVDKEKYDTKKDK